MKMGIVTALILTMALLTMGTSTITTTTTTAYAQTTTVPPSSTTPYPPPEPNRETPENNNIYVDITNPHHDTSRIITNLTWYEENRLIVRDNPNTATTEYGETKVAEPLSPENIQYQQEDPNFNRLAQLTYDCLNDYHTIFRTHTVFTVESKTRHTWCIGEINKEINQICENAVGATTTTFNAPLNNKCEEAREMSGTYLQLAETLFG